MKTTIIRGSDGLEARIHHTTDRSGEAIVNIGYPPAVGKPATGGKETRLPGWIFQQLVADRMASVAENLEEILRGLHAPAPKLAKGKAHR